MINLKTEKIMVASREVVISASLIVDEQSYSSDTEREGEYFNIWKWGGPPYSIEIVDSSLEQKVIANRFSEIGPEIRRIELRRRPLVPHALLFHTIAVEQLDERFYISVRPGFKSSDWNLPWSFSAYKRMITRLILKHPSERLAWFEIQFPWGQRKAITYRVNTLVSTIQSEISNLSLIFQEIHERAEESLSSRIDKDSIRMFFSFPEEVKVPCEQYLLYFSQFLRDLGVQADTSLRDEAGQVLFTVTPTERTDALEKIRQALSIYLKLASSPIDATPTESIATQRLESTVLRLRSDLKLAAAELQAKNTTIEAQQLIMNVQKRLLSGDIVVESMTYETPRPEDKEYLLDDLVSLGTYEKGGVGLNLGEMVRKLKQFFREE